jgi:hypothetical protein
LAWHEGQKFRVWQKKARKCSAWHSGHRIRAKPLTRRPQSRYWSTTCEPRLETLLVGTDVILEVFVEEAVEGGSFRVSRRVDRRGRADE